MLSLKLLSFDVDDAISSSKLWVSVVGKSWSCSVSSSSSGSGLGSGLWTAPGRLRKMSNTLVSGKGGRQRQRERNGILARHCTYNYHANIWDGVYFGSISQSDTYPEVGIMLSDATCPVNTVITRKDACLSLLCII